MHRRYFYLVAFLWIATTPVSLLAETSTTPATGATHSRDWVDTANDEGFYIDLPAVNYRQLIGLIRTYRTYLTDRKKEIARYLEEHRLDGKDVLITAILPGGLLYAAVRKGQLEQAKAELSEVSEDIAELSRDLLAMQAVAGELTVAQLE